MSTKQILLSPDLGLLAMRLMIGVVGVFHGAGKLFNVFDGPGLKAFADALKGINVPAPYPAAVLAGVAECFGGALIAVGLFPRLAAIPFAFNMFVAFFMAHKGVFSGAKQGGEYALTLAVFAVGLFFTGAGKYSIAGLLGARGPAPKSST